MSITINGTTGISGVDGSSTAPAFQGNDTNTGIFYPAADTIAFAEGGVEAMRLDSSGNVGIGTTSPVTSYRLSIYDQTNGATNISGLALIEPGSATSYSYFKTTSQASADTRTIIGNGAASRAFAFETGGTERMRIASNGQMLLGTTTNSGRSPPLIISNDSGTTNWAVGPSSGGSTQFYVSAGAGVYLSSTSATSWTANSDERLKNITGKIENALDAISTLTPAKFTWKSDEENTPQVGLIAQEVEKVLPEVVDKNADGYLGVRYTETIPLLVAAIQEQQTIINDLKARVTALEASNV